LLAPGPESAKAARRRRGRPKSRRRRRVIRSGSFRALGRISSTGPGPAWMWSVASRGLTALSDRRVEAETVPQGSDSCPADDPVCCRRVPGRQLIFRKHLGDASGRGIGSFASSQAVGWRLAAVASVAEVFGLRGSLKRASRTVNPRLGVFRLAPSGRSSRRARYLAGRGSTRVVAPDNE